MSVTVKIKRFDPAVDTSAHFEEYSVPVPKDDTWTVMDVLDYIHEHLDSSVAYFRHSMCDRGICARCATRVNGKPQLICQFPSPSEGELVLEPVKKDVVRDLVSK